MTTDTRTVEIWLDALNAVFGVDTGRGSKVATPKVTVSNAYPESLPSLPVALSWPVSLEPTYGAPDSSAPTILIWQGETEMHLTPDVKKSNLPYVYRFFGRILAAAKANITLGGLVEYFIIPKGANSMEPAILQYGGEAPHIGIIIRWTVKQNLSGQI